ncbi:MAG TPA: alpha/beta hydrolase [Candidatus Saccharimonadales bacterium]|nr:alpha/beta hydrolase [Candidatus Saccharimonadales bacterium]
MQHKDPDPAQYVTPLNMNGLQGRMLRLPATKPTSRELLVVYGHHAMLERWWGIIQNFASFGNVTMPDLPGFGGMDSFYKIGQKPTIDNLADYLASFIKLRYKRRRITIIGISFGFVVVTRMLQRYPEIAKKVTVVVSCVGFAHRDDFLFSKARLRWYRYASLVASVPPNSFLFKRLFLNKWVLRYAYTKTHNARHKFEAAAAQSPEIFNAVLETEIKLWAANDIRTHLYTTYQFLGIDNCQKRVDVPVWHAHAKKDYYFDNRVVEQHFRVIFKDYTGVEFNLATHAPSVNATKKEAADFIPSKLRRMLKELD